jgi:hypothetical protein
MKMKRGRCLLPAEISWLVLALGIWPSNDGYLVGRG